MGPHHRQDKEEQNRKRSGKGNHTDETDMKISAAIPKKRDKR